MGLLEPSDRYQRADRQQALSLPSAVSLAMPIPSISDLNLRGRKVLVRCDFNVPLEGGKITDPSRVDASLDTIRHILSQGGAAILCSHLGRPKERALELS